MANRDQPCGSVPHERALRVRPYTAGSAIYPGDLVTLSSDGKVDTAAAGPLLGVAMSYASADAAQVLVADHPDQLIEIQADTTEVDAQTDVGLNYPIVNTAASTAYKISRQELDASAGATDSTLPLRLVGIVPRADNALGGFVDCVCVINNHQLKGGTGTVGV